jgi:hypothetical protein
MITARTLVRFVFAGLFVNALAVACVVSDGDDDDDTTACDPGSYKDCTCPNGDASQRKCSASGNGYGACACSGENVGGGGAGGEPSSTAGTTSNYGGEAGKSAGGAGGAGGENAGGMMSEGGAAGAATNPDDLCVEDPDDDCQTCVQVGCCDEWTACSEDTANDCQQQFFNIMVCAQDERATRNITPADLEACAELEVDGGSAWSDGLLPTTKALIDCVGGGQNWENRAWNDDSCNALCFLQE